MKKQRVVKFKKEELDWIERTADIETARLFQNFNKIMEFYKDANKKQKKILDKQIEELTELYVFLKTLRSKIKKTKSL